jgi:hypothetical protein
MKISLLYAHWEEFGEQASTPMTWRDELRRQGHEVDVYNLYAWNGKVNPKTRVHQYSDEGFIQLYWDIKKGKECDAIFILDYGPYQNRNLNKANFPGQVLIKEAGDTPQSYRMHLQTANQFDIVVTPDLASVEEYKKLNIKAYWQPHFADHVFYPRPDLKPIAKVATSCGSRGAGLTEKLAKHFGNDFINNRVCNGDEHAELLNSGHIVFHKSAHTEIGRRIFEGMALKRMVLTDRLSPATGLQNLFTEDKEIVFYDDFDDCVAKIEHYSGNPELRDSIAEAGYRKVISGHTINHRVAELISLIDDVRRI